MIEQMMTVEEVADALRVRPASVRTWARTHGLPHIRIGARKILVAKNDLEEWLMQQRRVCNQARANAGRSS